MANSERDSRTTAFVNALQDILDSLTDQANNEDTVEIENASDQNNERENTYELFIDRLSRKSLSSLIICITLVCALHAADTGGES